MPRTSMERRVSRRVKTLAIGLTVGSGMLVSTAAVAAQAAGRPTAPVGRLNKIIENAEAGRVSFGGGESWILLPDLEHDLFGPIRLQAAMAANWDSTTGRFKAVPGVRINQEANHQAKHIVKQTLDAGMMLLVLPQSETPEQVAEFISAMRYPPQGQFYATGPRGQRGWSAGAAARYWGVDTETYMRKADVWPLNPEGELLACILIETKSIVEHIEEVIELPGLGCMLIGTQDMTMNYGLGTPAPAGNHPIILAAIERVARACAAHHARGGKVICGAYQTPHGLAKNVEEFGFRIFTGGRGNPPYTGDRR
mgnify:CR=1 FL=1